jgi:L-arabinose isomerase
MVNNANPQLQQAGRHDGAHHTGFSQSLTMEHLQDFADMADLELLCIDGCTQLRQFRNELRWNAATYQ